MKSQVLTVDHLSMVCEVGSHFLKEGVCPKCWMGNLGREVMGSANEFYTWDAGEEGIWGWDIDLAHELTQGRVDASVDWRTLLPIREQCEYESMHLRCLARTKSGGDGAFPPILIVDETISRHGRPGSLVIDGTHRAILATIVERNLPATILTQEENAQCMVVGGEKGKEAYEKAAEYVRNRLEKKVREKGGIDLEVLSQACRSLSGLGRYQVTSHLLEMKVPRMMVADITGLEAELV